MRDLLTNLKYMGGFNRDNRSGGGFRGKRNFGGRGGFGGHGGNFRGRDRRPMTMHQAVCDKCKQSCEVPFKPTGDRPVFCNNCFERPAKMGGDRFSKNNFSRSGFGEKKMFSATCDTCKQSCEVPFPPRPGRPVQCDKCFSGKRGGNDSSDAIFKKLDLLNNKLELIINTLNINAVKLTPLKENTVKLKVKEGGLVDKKAVKRKLATLSKTKKVVKKTAKK